MAESCTSCKSCPAFEKSIFKNVKDQTLTALSSAKEVMSYERGEIFSQENKPTDHVYCLMQGSAKVTLYGKSIVRLAAPGDLLGYRCIFSETAYRATASALNESKACKIHKSVIFEIIQSEPDFAFEILGRMGREIASAEHHHHSFCKKNVRERLAEALCILNEKFGVKTEQGYKINTVLTRLEISTWIGAAKETVIRELTDFKMEGLIADHDKYIYITDLAKLEKIFKY